MNKTGVVILAAGNSSRLGRPKQLVIHQGKPLIAHIVDEALAAGLDPVVVVTGAFASETGAALAGRPVGIIDNARWEEGMATSIITGVSALLETHPGIEAVILSVCDQPFLSASVFREMVERRVQSEKGIVACFYRDVVGTPVLFTAVYFRALASLTGGEGAKKLLLHYKDDLAVVSFPKGYIDIDEPADFEHLQE